MWVRPLCREDPLEEGMSTYSSILAWKIPWTEETGRLHAIGSQRVRQETNLVNCLLFCQPDSKINSPSISNSIAPFIKL